MINNIFLRKIFIAFIISISLFSITYRFGANFKYIPVIMGVQSKRRRCLVLSLTSGFSFKDGSFFHPYDTKTLTAMDGEGAEDCAMMTAPDFGCVLGQPINVPTT